MRPEFQDVVADVARYGLVRDRDDEDAARVFAENAYRSYRSGLYGRNRMTNPTYRTRWLQSAITFRRLKRGAVAPPEDE